MSKEARTINVGDGPSIFIMGAGIAAITIGLEFDRRGLTNWTAFERSDGIGGTWWANRYPGCRCDVPAIVYSHSKNPNPNWSQSHPEREEIQQYWENLADSHGQKPRIKLKHNILKAEWDASRKLYRVTVRDLEAEEDVIYEAQVLIGAAGALCTPRQIDLPGKDNFNGKVIHAADWPRDLSTEMLRGKNVVVVGNGCSGVQIVGTLGLDPDINIVSLARARQWFVPSDAGQPRHSIPYSDKRREWYKKFPLLMNLERRITWVVMDSLFYWYQQKEGKRARAKMEKQLTEWMMAELPEYMRENAIPSHPFGSKRLIFEDGYFAALKQPNVKFIEGKIKSVHDSVAVLDDGSEIPADYVVLATGYDAETHTLHVSGSEDSTENYKSRAAFQMYRGTALPGLPNYFTMLGNNTALNHMGITSVLEIQASYIAQLVQAMRDYNLPELDVKRDAALKYDAWIEEELQKMTWSQVKNTYWQAGRDGRIFTHYPGSVKYMMWDFATPVWNDYKGAESVARAQAIRRTAILATVVIAVWWGLFRTAQGARLSQSVVDLISSVFGRSKHLLATTLPTLAARIGFS